MVAFWSGVCMKTVASSSVHTVQHTSNLSTLKITKHSIFSGLFQTMKLERAANYVCGVDVLPASDCRKKSKVVFAPK
jgi:hypothetical protein